MKLNKRAFAKACLQANKRMKKRLSMKTRIRGKTLKKIIWIQEKGKRTDFLK